MTLVLRFATSLVDTLNPFRTKQEIKNWKGKGNIKQAAGLNLFTFQRRLFMTILISLPILQFYGKRRRRRQVVRHFCQRITVVL